MLRASFNQAPSTKHGFRLTKHGFICTSLKQASKLESTAQRLGSDVEAYERLQLFQSCLPFRTFCEGFQVFSSGVFVFEVHVVVRFRPFKFLSGLWMGKRSWQIVPSN